MSVRALRRGAIASSRATGPPPIVVGASVNSAGTYDFRIGAPNAAFAFQPASNLTVVGVEVFWTSDTPDGTSGTLHIATNAARTTPISSVPALNDTAGKASTWDRVLFDSGVALSSATVYVIAVATSGTNLAVRGSGASAATLVNLTSAPHCAYGTNWATQLNSYSGCFRLLVNG